MTKSAVLALKRKNRAWQKYKSQKSQWAATKYRRERNICTTQIRLAKLNFEKRIAEEAKLNPKSFWNYTRSRLKNSSTIPQLMNSDGNLTENDDHYIIET